MITDPSGPGAFAEAMRELIAQLTPVPDALRQQTPAQLGEAVPVCRARRPALCLVR